VSAEDKEVFESFGVTHPVVSVIGDTRYDQVWRRSAESRTRRLIDPKVLEEKKVLVIGSSWREDEEILIPACRSVFETHPCFLVILVPHEPTEENLERIESSLNGSASSIRFSNLHEYRGEKIILIDSIGILMGLYQYADAAFVGGSFRGGVHNVLEPAAYGVPVLFGPKHTNSREAMDMLGERAGLTGGDTWTVANELRRLLDDDAWRREVGERALTIVKRNVGATDRFLAYLEQAV
jgi:3-deoxy-D-manno-octulosonic-acid transferase